MSQRKRVSKIVKLRRRTLITRRRTGDEDKVGAEQEKVSPQGGGVTLLQLCICIRIKSGCTYAKVEAEQEKVSPQGGGVTLLCCNYLRTRTDLVMVL